MVDITFERARIPHLIVLVSFTLRANLNGLREYAKNPV
jgi:hypothetical protein